MAKKNGRILVLELDGIPIAAETSCEISWSRDMIDITNKASNSNREIMPGLKSASLSVEALIDFAATHGGHTFATALNNGTAMTFVLGDGVAGQTEFTGTCYAGDFTMSAANEDVVTWSGTLEITGAITIQTIT